MAWRIVSAVVQHALSVHLKGGLCTSSSTSTCTGARSSLIASQTACDALLWVGLYCNSGPLTFSLENVSLGCTKAITDVHGMFLRPRALFVYVSKIYLCTIKWREYSQAHFQRHFPFLSLSFTHTRLKKIVVMIYFNKCSSLPMQNLKAKQLLMHG